MDQLTIRAIEKKDNAALATIIRNALVEFKANKQGTVFFDDSTDHLYELFQQPQSFYHVAVHNNIIVGGAGIFPSKGLQTDTCELVKMYLATSSRNLGIGKKLMLACLNTATQKGYKNIYLETMPELVSAIPLYEKFGFTYLEHLLGNTGHNGCGIWMIRQL